MPPYAIVVLPINDGTTTRSLPNHPRLIKTVKTKKPSNSLPKPNGCGAQARAQRLKTMPSSPCQLPRVLQLSFDFFAPSAHLWKSTKPSKNSSYYSSQNGLYVPCITNFAFANRQTSPTVFQYFTTCADFHRYPRARQGQVPILLRVDQMRNLHITSEHTPQCDKITCAAFAMIRQPIPVSSGGHAKFDLAAFCKRHNARTANKAFDDDMINPIAYPSPKEPIAPG